ncbi:Uncharacterised protein [Serratia rubidaea]|nr:Uncharacterised protein [Serratia rubidaea]
MIYHNDLANIQRIRGVHRGKAAILHPLFGSERAFAGDKRGAGIGYCV